MLKTDKNEFQWPYDQAFIWALVIFLLNLTLKGLFLEFPDFGHDEPFTLFRAQKSYSELITDLAANNHPPLFESIIWVWLRIVGYKVEMLRLIPLFFSALAALVIFWFGRKHFSQFVGIVAALLFTFSDYHFYLSHEIRSYSLLAFLTVLSFSSYFNLFEGYSTNKKMAGYIVINSLLLYTHYFGATVIVLQLFHALAVMRDRQLNLKLLKALSITALLYLPQILMVKSRLVNKIEGGHWLATPSIDELFNVLRKFFNLPLLAVIAIVFAVSAFWLARNKPYYKKLLAVGLLFPGTYFGMWFLAQSLPVFQDRYVSFTLIGSFILIAITLEQLPKKVRLFVTVVFVGAMAMLTNYKPQNRQWVPEMVNIIKKEKTENTKVFIYPNWSLQCFSYHYNLEYFKNYDKTRALLAEQDIYLGYKQNVNDFISRSEKTEKFIIINFEGPISELAKVFGHLNPRIIEKERHGVMILKVE